MPSTVNVTFVSNFQGSRPYQSVQVDYQSVRFLPAAIAGLEAKYVVAGAVAVAATIAATRKSKSEQAAVQQFAINFGEGHKSFRCRYLWCILAR